MATVESFDELEELLSSNSVSGGRLIGFDGVDASGKSTVATMLNSRLGARVISLDNFWQTNQNSYVDNLDYSAIAAELNSPSTLTIIEGVCLLAVCKRLRISLDVHVYFKRVSAIGTWIDAEVCESQESPETVIIEQGNLVRRITRALGNPVHDDNTDIGLTEFRKEIIRYHSQYCPSKIAHHFFHWRDVT